MKIVSISKFVRSILIIIGIMVGIILLINSTSFSHGNVSYKTVYVGSGDTLWSIAKEEKILNSYYEKKNIRDIVEDIKMVNDLHNSDLKINQELQIPNI